MALALFILGALVVASAVVVIPAAIRMDNQRRELERQQPQVMDLPPYRAYKEYND